MGLRPAPLWEICSKILVWAWPMHLAGYALPIPFTSGPSSLFVANTNVFSYHSESNLPSWFKISTIHFLRKTWSISSFICDYLISSGTASDLPELKLKREKDARLALALLTTLYIPLRQREISKCLSRNTGRDFYFKSGNSKFNRILGTMVPWHFYFVSVMSAFCANFSYLAVISFSCRLQSLSL